MTIVLQSLANALGQLGDKRIMLILLKSLAITLAILLIGGGVALFSLYKLLSGWDAIGNAEVSALAAAALTILAGWLLFRIIALGVMQFFADEVVAAVEAQHYAEHGEALPFRQDVQNSLKSMGRALLFNLLALPVAALLIFTAIGPGIVFLLVNAVLLGRELTDMCWLRLCAGCRLSPEELAVSKGEKFLLGATIAGLMLIPLANFLAPIIGAAAGTHLVHLKRARQQKEVA